MEWKWTYADQEGSLEKTLLGVFRVKCVVVVQENGHVKPPDLHVPIVECGPHAGHIHNSLAEFAWRTLLTDRGPRPIQGDRRPE
jgi:hypothetical protein